MNKHFITNHQLFTITGLYTMGTSILVISAGTASIAKQDAWISALITPVLGTLLIEVIWILGKWYPGKTLVELIQIMFGKWIGWIIGAIFSVSCLVVTSQVLWYSGNFITTQSMPETPAMVINLLFMSVIVVAILIGIESFGRACEVFLSTVSVLFIITMLLSLQKADFNNLLPVFENGISPTLKGTITLSAYTVFPLIVLYMIFPVNIDNTYQAGKMLLFGYLWGAFIIFLSIVMSLLVLGSTITSKSEFPIYLVAKEINIGIIISRFEFIVAVIWIITLFIRNSIYFYSGVIGISQLLGLKNHKKIVIPAGLIVLVLSSVVYPDSMYAANWDTFVWPPYIYTLGSIPVLLLLIALFKRKLYKTRNK